MKLLERRKTTAARLAVGPITPEKARREQRREARLRRRTLRFFLVIGVIAHAGYATLFLASDAVHYRPLIVVAIAAVVGFAVAWQLLRSGHELTAGVMSQLVPVIPVIAYTSAFSSESGIPQLLLVGAIGVFVFIPGDRALLRIEVAVILAGAVLFCEIVFPPESGWHQLSHEKTELFATFNRSFLAFGLLVLGGILHRRSIVAQRLIEGTAEHARKLAATDTLTGLYNRRPLMEDLRELSRDHRHDFAIGIMDIDKFKVLNDTFGHECGDAVLRKVSKTLKKSVRGEDLVGRWGGEEFLFVFHHTDPEEASATLDRIRRRIEKTVTVCPEHEHTVTVSVGVAGSDGRASLDERIRRADDALYRAKESGRNRVETHEKASV